MKDYFIFPSSNYSSSLKLSHKDKFIILEIDGIKVGFTEDKFVKQFKDFLECLERNNNSNGRKKL